MQAFLSGDWMIGPGASGDPIRFGYEIIKRIH